MADGREKTELDRCGLCLRYPPNWPLTVFLGVLALLHLAIAAPAFASSAVEAQVCVAVGALFGGAALLCGLVHRELTIRPDRGWLSVGRSLGPLRLECKVPFAKVQAVRLTFTPSTSAERPRIDVLCVGRVISSPMTLVPRQQALCMAVLMKVQLLKIYSKQEPCLTHRMDEAASHESIKGDLFRSDENKSDDNLMA